MQKSKILKSYLFIFITLISLVACDNDKGEKDSNSNTIQTKLTENTKTAEDYLNIGLDYYFGRGVKQDYSQAIQYYQKAAKLGNASAMNNLSIMYIKGDGVKQDIKKQKNFL